VEPADGEVTDEGATDDEQWLASLPPGYRALVTMMLNRLIDAENDSTRWPRT
jgi:hypothetical protein